MRLNIKQRFRRINSNSSKALSGTQIDSAKHSQAEGFLAMTASVPRQKQHPPAGFLYARGLLCCGNGNRKKAACPSEPPRGLSLRRYRPALPSAVRMKKDARPRWNRPRPRHHPQVCRSYRLSETGGTANAGSKRNGCGFARAFTALTSRNHLENRRLL